MCAAFQTRPSKLDAGYSIAQRISRTTGKKLIIMRLPTVMTGQILTANLQKCWKLTASPLLASSCAHYRGVTASGKAQTTYEQKPTNTITKFGRDSDWRKQVCYRRRLRQAANTVKAA